MPPDAPSNVRVFVEWRDQTVFAGEEVRCTITFKNVAPESNGHGKQHRQHGDGQILTTVPLNGSGQAKTTASPGSLASPPAAGSARRHHRAALSLSVPVSSPSRSRSGSMPWPQTASSGDWRPGHTHKRSVSIVSIGSAGGIEEQAQRRPGLARLQSSRRGHNRAASLQIPTRGMQPLSPSGPHSGMNPRHTSSPLFNAPYPPDRYGREMGPSSAPNTPGQASRRSPRGQLNPMPDFKFPAQPAPDAESQRTSAMAVHDLGSPQSRHTAQNNLALRPKEHGPSSNEGAIARILSSTSVSGGTPRSSGDFYSLSNHSSETLASEYVTRPLVGAHGRPSHLRRTSSMARQHPRAPESLMMGYAQIHGSFTLDGSLVSLGQFEQVKKKAAVGARGGGVIGLESPRRESGLLGGFGWGNISSSLGDLWGGGQLSTLKEMRGAVNSKSVPLLSTPQSILFVDMHLEPGESRAFEYSFNLPRGLPPTHKGKAIKFSYSLVIGTQRAGGAREQNVRSVEVPFRVLGSVNSHGEVLGHDLMKPYVLLRDEAEVKSLSEGNKTPIQTTHETSTSGTLNDFLNYVDKLTANQKDGTGGTLLSPTEASNTRRSSAFEEVTTAKEAIHSAIMRSNVPAEGQQSPNRFEIARNGQRVAVVMLTRPAYRLGEVITMAIDFTNADIPCYAVHTTLETSEKVDSSLAIRSEASIQRVTRKVYAMSSEATLYSRRAVFAPAIPISATPDFVTSGVSLEWKIRIEFVVGYQGNEEVNPEEAQRAHPLLEQISQDEKGGLVLVAVENLACESFDVCVPLRVYGAVCNGLERLERDGASEEGLVV